MPRTRVVNLRYNRFDVYIGRPSKWGNPFILDRHTSRDEVIEKYRKYIEHRPELMACAQTELKGKVLGCFCKPEKCHGDILVQIAEGEYVSTNVG